MRNVKAKKRFSTELYPKTNSERESAFKEINTEDLLKKLIDDVFEIS